MLTITKFPAEAVDDHVNVHSRRGYQRNLRDADRAAVPCQLYMLPPACIFMQRSPALRMPAHAAFRFIDASWSGDGGARPMAGVGGVLVEDSRRIGEAQGMGEATAGWAGRVILAR